jgi:hypothetical protein
VGQKKRLPKNYSIENTISLKTRVPTPTDVGEASQTKRNRSMKEVEVEVKVEAEAALGFFSRVSYSVISFTLGRKKLLLPPSQFNRRARGLRQSLTINLVNKI